MNIFSLRDEENKKKAPQLLNNQSLIIEKKINEYIYVCMYIFSFRDEETKKKTPQLLNNQSLMTEKKKKK
jgi:hypothetical protein